MCNGAITRVIHVYIFQMDHTLLSQTKILQMQNYFLDHLAFLWAANVALVMELQVMVKKVLKAVVMMFVLAVLVLVGLKLVLMVNLG